MVEFKFKVRVPMDCWRQWIRHRTANVNEYSTRYSEAIDSQQTTLSEEWRLQAKDNKQGSSGFLEEWPKTPATNIYYDEELKAWIINGLFNSIQAYDSRYYIFGDAYKQCTPGQLLTQLENELIEHSKEIYNLRLALGIAREQARKDLPLSTYTEAYWKCDLHNIFNFLKLRLDPHAQLEIRLYTQTMYEIVKQICPIACEAFEDYVLNAKKFSTMEMKVLKDHIPYPEAIVKQHNMTDNEWSSFLKKLV